MSGSDSQERDGVLHRPAVIATLVAVPITVVAVFIAVAATRPSSSEAPLPLSATSAPRSQDPACGRLLTALPRTFAGFGPRDEASGLVQWKASGGDATGPVQLRCGVDRPADLAPTSALQTVNPVQWFSTSTDTRGTLWTAVDHRPYVALWSPTNAGSGPITDVSQVIDRVLARGPIDLGR